MIVWAVISSSLISDRGGGKGSPSMSSRLQLGLAPAPAGTPGSGAVAGYLVAHANQTRVVDPKIEHMKKLQQLEAGGLRERGACTSLFVRDLLSRARACITAPLAPCCLSTLLSR